MAEFVAVCRTDEVLDGTGHPVMVNGLGIAIFNDGGRFYALLGRCPHSNGPMGQGWVEDGEAVCPLHQWRFKLATGRCTTDRGYTLYPFRCEVRDDQVWVEV
jgi:nitrite reductase/ring-hydroxylating ferredoxin subunit